MNQKKSSGSNSVDNMAGNDREVKYFLKNFIHPLEILKMGCLNFKIFSLKFHK